MFIAINAHYLFYLLMKTTQEKAGLSDWRKRRTGLVYWLKGAGSPFPLIKEQMLKVNTSEFLAPDLDCFTLVELQLTLYQKQCNLSQIQFEQLMSFTSRGEKRHLGEKEKEIFSYTEVLFWCILLFVNFHIFPYTM